MLVAVGSGKKSKGLTRSILISPKPLLIDWFHITFATPTP